MACLALTFLGGKKIRNRDKRSLSRQVKDNLDSKLTIGRSKTIDKISGEFKKNIYSWSTYRDYMKHANYFTNWCRENYGCKTLEDCRPHADEWLQHRIDQGLSPYTLKLEVSALAKVYDCSSKDFISTPSRHREHIERSRSEAVRDKHFSEARNSALVEFCRSTGLRRSELKSLTGDKLEQINGHYYIRVDVGSKGGRERLAPVVGNEQLVVERMNAAGNAKVWENVHNGADIHSYRSEYAVRVYKAYERDLNTLDRKDIYYCRGDLKGVKYDKAAMLEASRALGHNRISVIAGHYLR